MTPTDAVCEIYTDDERRWLLYNHAKVRAMIAAREPVSRPRNAQERTEQVQRNVREIEDGRAKLREPVSLKRCIAAIKETICFEDDESLEEKAKAVLEAAGVKYED